MARLRARVVGQFRTLFHDCTVLDFLLISLAAGVCEEVFFRGLVQRGLAGSIGEGWALLAAGLLFAVAHPVTTFYAVLAGLMGLYLGALLWLFGDLTVPVVAHAAHDMLALEALRRFVRRPAAHQPEGAPRIDWPADQSFLSPEEARARSDRCLEPFRDTLRAHRIDADLVPLLDGLYLPLAAWLRRRGEEKEGALVVGLCGAQGSGKSTVADLLRVVLETGFGCAVATIPLDGLYKTRARRQQLAREVHPLFATRGVPGTHDVDLGIRVIESLGRQAPGRHVGIPTFDKARDDRLPESRWPSFEGPARVILFEGWCVGAVPQAEAELAEPVNELEREEDPDGVWRAAVNRALDGPYRALFDRIDVQLLLQVEGMGQVLRWRRLQERKLAEEAVREAAAAGGLRIMSEPEVDRFVMHSERLTRHILSEMPARAEVVMKVGDSHSPVSVRINRPIG
jgi:D-glycerate 3-kinase